MESGNAQQFAEKIQDIIHNRSAYRKKAEEYRQYTIENYSWDAICEQYEKLFAEMLEANRQ